MAGSTATEGLPPSYARSFSSARAGNVYIADTDNCAIREWATPNGPVTTLVGSGLSDPFGVAVDEAGNVYIADTYDCATKKWATPNGPVTTLVGSGLYYPYGVAVDGAGNVYFSDSGYNVIEKWAVADGTLTTLVGSRLYEPHGVAVDGSGNVYIADTGNSAVKKWSVADGATTTLVGSGLNNPRGVAVDEAGNVYIADSDNSVIEELPRAFVDPTPRVEPYTAGTDALPVVLPVSENLLAPFAPGSDSPWLTISGVTNGVVSFAFAASPTNRTAHITLLGQLIAVTQIVPVYSLGTTNLLEGPAAGSDSVVLAVTPPSASWTASTNAPWLHLSTANQSGAGATNLVFSFDANPGATRTDTLTIAGLTLTVTQAGSTYVLAPGPVTTVVGSGLNTPCGVAVDGAGNVYIADTDNNAIKKWVAVSNTVTTLVGSGLNNPSGVAVDGVGNVYIADTDNNAIKQWAAPNGPVTTLVGSGLYHPFGVAVDGAGNVYVADTDNNAIKQWAAPNGPVTTVVGSGLNTPCRVAVDGAGNVYIADSFNNATKKWAAPNGPVTTLVGSGLSDPRGVAVDGAGNVYVADTYNNATKKWAAADGTTTTLVGPGLYDPFGVAVDGAGNVYIADTFNNAIKELPRAFVDSTPRLAGCGAGADVLPPVLPVTANLGGPFAPCCDQPWLTVTGVTNGIVSFAFTANTNAASRTAPISLLGRLIPVTQAGLFAPGFTSVVMTGPSALSLTFSGSQGQGYTVLMSTNLTGPMPSWVPLTNGVFGSGPVQFTDTSATNGERFYRILVP